MRNKYLVCRKFKLALCKKALVAGVLNVTPDSFSDGGEYFNIRAAYNRALKMQCEGADIIDIGGESTRPGAAQISVTEELRRVIPLVKKLQTRLKIPISVDTRKPEVAKQALAAGASIINDITGLLHDKRTGHIISSYNAAVIIMHMKGTPQTMQNAPRYTNLISEVKRKLKQGIEAAQAAGINKSSIIIDPGIGFGKTVKHNLKLINNIAEFKKLKFPLLIGLSRKSFIGKTLNLDVGKRLIPTAACNAIAIQNGADIIRVHDVMEGVWTRDMVYSIISS
ncbi:MAG: dihydropteroate synthase [Candidatus Omnitrophota bacterium]